MIKLEKIKHYIHVLKQNINEATATPTFLETGLPEDYYFWETVVGDINFVYFHLAAIVTTKVFKGLTFLYLLDGAVFSNNLIFVRYLALMLWVCILQFLR